ncbi:MAG: 30S ribosomal protein S27ae [Candidatus Nitrosotenuis sp.]|nr:MAG: 30S ribosomal protein S27ae [Candidatus Nitrosotenuis sp.]
MAGKKAAAGGTDSIHKYYKIAGDKVTRLHRLCSRCGKGVFMSEHKNRRTCGKCGLTEFNQ